MIEVIGRLDKEDLARWRMCSVKLAAISTNPDLYSAREIENAFMEDCILREEFYRKYDIDDSRNWVVSQFTGTIYYSE